MRLVNETGMVFDILQLEVAKPRDQKKNVVSYLWQTNVGINVLCPCTKQNKTEQPQKETLTYTKKIALW